MTNIKITSESYFIELSKYLLVVPFVIDCWLPRTYVSLNFRLLLETFRERACPCCHKRCTVLDTVPRRGESSRLVKTLLTKEEWLCGSALWNWAASTCNTSLYLSYFYHSNFFIEVTIVKPLIAFRFNGPVVSFSPALWLSPSLLLPPCKLNYLTVVLWKQPWVVNNWWRKC